VKVPRVDDDSLMTYPCAFNVKAMGLNESNFENAVVEIVRRHLERDEPVQVHSRLSRHDKYRAVTVAFTAISREQLDSIYRDLTDEPLVLVAL
jgi:uncharacterized protein